MPGQLRAQRLSGRVCLRPPEPSEEQQRSASAAATSMEAEPAAPAPPPMAMYHLRNISTATEIMD
eukprot:COSAG01_NODE_2061_length_8482_cov_6.301925_10_plen_65_part_00